MAKAMSNGSFSNLWSEVFSFTDIHTYEVKVIEIIMAYDVIYNDCHKIIFNNLYLPNYFEYLPTAALKAHM